MRIKHWEQCRRLIPMLIWGIRLRWERWMVGGV